MLVDRYPVDKRFEEIRGYFPTMSGSLAKIDAALEDEGLFQLLRADLSRRRKKTLYTGRNSTPVEVILRMLVIKRLYNWSYEETERMVSDSLVLREFCRIYLNRVPDDTTLLRAANEIGAETLETFNQRIMHIAQAAKLTGGQKLRTDGTVVESHIHAPSDNQQLADSVRVLERITQRGKQRLGQLSQQVVEASQQVVQTAKQKSRQIGETLRKGTAQAKEVGRQAYEELLQLTEQSVEQAQQTAAELRQHPDRQAHRLVETLETFVPRAQQVIQQTRRRILQGESIPASEKLVSIFEAHADIIKRNKANKPVEYGHKVWLDEVEGGLISHYRVLEGNPSDTEQWLPSIDAHIDLFDHPPTQASADRGVHSPDNEREAKQRGVAQVILPKPGYRSEERLDYEHQDWFASGRKWHAGVEGRISVLKRAHGLGRCRNHGWEGFKTWVGWGVVAGNLAVIGRS